MEQPGSLTHGVLGPDVVLLVRTACCARFPPTEMTLNAKRRLALLRWGYACAASAARGDNTGQGVFGERGDGERGIRAADVARQQ